MQTEVKISPKLRVWLPVKRLFDIMVSVIGLLLLSPILFLGVIALAVAQSGQVWFRQMRPGKDEKPFMLVKFKTMRDAQDDAGQLMPDADRLTRVGSIFRKLSLDEIPQLWNVLKGDMSLIGPRPLLMEYLPLYNNRQRGRHLVKPGITGWAQVNGRNELGWKDRFEHDIWYIENWSLVLELKILFTTLKHVLQRKGISQQGHATAEKFTGNE